MVNIVSKLTEREPSTCSSQPGQGRGRGPAAARPGRADRGAALVRATSQIWTTKIWTDIH